MRKLGLSLLLSTVVALPAAAWSQDSQQPAASSDDYVCAFSGQCAADDETQPAEQTPTTGRPRITATRGFAISTTSTAPRSSTARPRRPAVATAAPRRLAVAAAQAPGARNQRVNLSLSFPTGSATLTPAAQAQARSFGQALLMPQLSNMRFRIEGHTDGVGNRASNVSLSRRRAQSVADYLVSMGVSRSRIDVQGYGPDRPLAGTARTSPQNRRVEAVRIS